MREGAIHRRRPKNRERPRRGELHALCEGARDERRGYAGEHAVKRDEDRRGVVASRREEGDAGEAAVVQGAEEGVEVVSALFHLDVAERDRVAPQDPHLRVGAVRFSAGFAPCADTREERHERVGGFGNVCLGSDARG